MASPLVGIVVGSRAEFTAIRKGLETLRVMGISYELAVLSAQQTPERVAVWAQEAQMKGMELIIAAGGGGTALPAIVAAHTPLPVIGVPVDSTPLRGQDALFAIVQAPAGAPVACVGVNAAENAALLAARILAIKYPRFSAVLLHRHQSALLRHEALIQELQAEFPDLTNPELTAPDDYRSGLAEQETDPGPAERKALQLEKSARTGAAAPHVEIETPEPHEPSPTRGAPPRRLRIDEVPTPPDEPPPAPPPAAASEPAGNQSISPLPLPPARAAAAPPPAPPRASAAPARKALDDRLFRVDAGNPDVDVIEHAMLTMLEGGLVAAPTDTVYCLAADATNGAAVERLHRLRGGAARALAVFVDNQKMLSRLVSRIPPKIEEVMEEFWPGPLTIIFSKPAGALAGVSAAPTIGVRIPDHNTILALISMIARPLATVSAKTEEGQPITEMDAMIQRFGESLDCLLDAGPTAGPVVSTVLSVVQEPYEIVREGAVSRERLKTVLGDLLTD